MALYVPFVALETSMQTWGKCHLVVACEADLGTKQKTGSYIVPNNNPTNNCKMKLAQDFFSFPQW